MENLDFSFLFFSDVRKDVSDLERYNFMKEIVTFADNGPFTAIYFPERHFYEFGSIYANPAILASWLIPQTKKIRFRTAGISLPLHHPAEIVEWWAMIDILSNGRVDLGFGSGWSHNDFILAPNHFHSRKENLVQMIEQVRRLWRGETVNFTGPDELDVPIKVFPRPIQAELNVWLLVTHNDGAFEFAGKCGYNIFTMLYGYDFEELARKIKLYRKARKESGYDPETGKVTLMLHTLIMSGGDEVRRKVEAPLKAYIKSAFNAHVETIEKRENLSDEQKEKVIDYAFYRYYKTSSLLGDIKHCKEIIQTAKDVSVNEIAFLVDFGVDYPTVISSLNNIINTIS